MSWIDTKKSIREVMSEPGPNGTLSWGRVASSFALIIGSGWVTYLLILVPPHTVPELRALLAELRNVTEWVLAPYGANKIMTTVQSFSSEKSDPCSKDLNR
jgi:hypothetical protein